MALKAKITKEEFDKLPQVIQAEYSETDAGYILAVDTVDGWALEDVTGLKSALAEERTNVSKQKNKLALFGDLDPVAAKEAMRKAEEIKNWKPDDKIEQQIKAREEQLVARHTEEMSKTAKERDTFRTQLEKQLVESSAVMALSKHKGNAVLLLPHVKSQTVIERDDKGEFRAFVVDGSGNKRITGKSGSTEPMTIDELVESMKTNDTYKTAFEGSGQQGPGQGGTRGAGGSGNHRISSTDAHNPQIYRQAKAAAEKAGAQLHIE